MQMSYLYTSDFPFKNFCKISQHAETIRKNVWEKSYGAYSLSIRVQTTINHISICFLPQYQRQRKCFFAHTHASSVVMFGTSNDWFVLSMRMQVILDSLFACPGSAPIWGRKKGEFRDWTSDSQAVKPDWLRL